MTHIIKEKLKSLLNLHPKPIGLSLSYGWDGFRARADMLPWVVVRIGLLAAIRSKIKQACVGVMITASHYRQQDNGVRMIDSNGEILHETWRVYATELATIEDNVEELWNYLASLMSRFNIHPNHDAIIGIAHDTRKSSLILVGIVKRAAQTLYTTIMDFELMTTPQLHFAIHSFNHDDHNSHYTETGYFNKIHRAFTNLIQTSSKVPKLHSISVDAANGVGAAKLAILRRKLQDFICIDIFNNGTNGLISENCGVDYVKLYERAPSTMQLTMGSRYCSIDGDADRLIYFFVDSQNQFRSLIGERLSSLYALFVCCKLRDAKLIRGIKIAVIQTAETNGGSINYITSHLKIPVVFAEANTECLRRKAQDYDVGIYFESSGHGTVHFSGEFKNKVKAIVDDPQQKAEERLAAKQILAFITIINENIGDAIANLFATEAILFILGLDLIKWFKLYNDLPQRKLNINATDLSMIRTSEIDYRCIAPMHLQDRIDELVSKYGSARAFIRRSNDKNVLSVFAEAATQREADNLAEEVREITEEFITMIADF